MKTLSNRIPIHSLRFKLPFIIIVIVAPLIILLIYFSQYSITVVHDQVAKSNKNLLALYMEQLDDSLTKVDKYLATLGATNYDFVNLASFNEDDFIMAKVSLVNRLNTDMRLYSVVDSFFVYVPARDDYFYTFFGERGTLQERIAMKTYIRERTRSGNRQIPRFSLEKWEVQTIGGEHYLFRVYDYGDVLLGAWANVERLMLPMDLINLGESGMSFYVDSRGMPLEAEASKMDVQIDVTVGDDYVYLLSEADERFLVIQQQSRVGDFRLVALVQEKSILEHLPFLRILVRLIFAGSLIALPVAFLILRKTVLVPLNRILAALKFTRDGFIEYRIENHRTSYEFQRVNEAFNQMMSQIHKLKIDIYEEQLGKQRAELKFLQLQLNPHFLLNALNVMHSLAFMKRFELIQELCVGLTQYFRYMLRSKVMFVPLEDELKHVKNYLRIQELRFHDQLTYEIRAPEICMNVDIPPLLIHIFVENCIKHAVTMEEPTHVSVEIQMIQETGAQLQIKIVDNGPGFSESVLQLIRRGEQIQAESGHHIGIWNVMRRLELLYGGKARTEFSNLAKGACVEIWVPLA